jgi:hypothetical protein
MTPEDDPFASFAVPREQLSPVEIWKRQRQEEARQWRRLKSVGAWLLGGTLLGSLGAAAAAESLRAAGAMVGGSMLGMPLGLAAGWLVGFGSWGGRFLRGTRMMPASEVPVPMLWLATCTGVGLVAGAALGSWTLPYLMLDKAAADRAAVLGPAGAAAGAAIALVVVWLRRKKSDKRAG